MICVNKKEIYVFMYWTKDIVVVLCKYNTVYQYFSSVCSFLQF